VEKDTGFLIDQSTWLEGRDLEILIVVMGDEETRKCIRSAKRDGKLELKTTTTKKEN
jgi:hypothetical protein